MSKTIFIISLFLSHIFIAQIIAQEIPISELGSKDPDSEIVEQEYPEIEKEIIDLSKRSRIHYLNGLYGYYNKEGVLTVPYSYKFMRSVKFEKLLKVKNETNKYGIIDKENNSIIDVKYENVTPAPYPSEFYIASNKQFALLLDKKGDTLIGPKYVGFNITENINEIIAIFKNPDNSRKTFLIDTLGNILQEYDKRNLYAITKVPNYFYSIDNGYKKGVIKKNGNTILPTIYNYVEYIANDRWKVSDSLKKTGVVNNKNEIIIPLNYKNINYLKSQYNTVYSVTKDNKIGILDNIGKIIIEPDYYKRIDTHFNNYFIIYNDQNTGIRNRDGKEILPLNNLKKTALCWSDNENPLLKIQGENDKYALFSSQVKQLTDYIYDSKWVCRGSGQFYQVSINGKQGVLNIKGKEIVPCIYDKTIIDKNQIYGIINGQKTLLISN